MGEVTSVVTRFGVLLQCDTQWDVTTFNVFAYFNTIIWYTVHIHSSIKLAALCAIFEQKLTVPEVPYWNSSQNLVPKVCEYIYKSGHTFGRHPVIY
jgi:hypothetical protein